MSLPSLLIDPDIRDFSFEVARGRRRGMIEVRQRGINKDLDNAAGEDVTNLTGVSAIVYPSSAESLELVSSSANDTIAGTGVRTVLVFGLDAGWNLISETVETNGTTAVALVNTYIRTHLVAIDICGSVNSNDGTLTLRVASAGATRMIVDVNLGESHQAGYSVPAGYEGFLHEWDIRLLDSVPANTKVDGHLWIRERANVGGGWRLRDESPLLEEPDHIEFLRQLRYPMKLAPMTDIRIAASTTTNNTIVGAGFNLVIVSQAVPDPGTEIASFVDETFAQGERVLVEGQANKRPFVVAGSLLDKDGLSTDLALWVGNSRILLETSAAGTKTKLEFDWIGRSGEAITIAGQGTGSGKYWITCGLIDDVVLGDRLRGE